MNFDKEAKSDKKELRKGGGGGGGGCTETNTVCQTVSGEVNTKMQLQGSYRNRKSKFQDFSRTFQGLFTFFPGVIFLRQ